VYGYQCAIMDELNLLLLYLLFRLAQTYCCRYSETETVRCTLRKFRPPSVVTLTLLSEYKF
jgi:hypothetical protein